MYQRKLFSENVSVLSCGGSGFCRAGEFGPTKPHDVLIKTVHTALNEGFNYFDTAFWYGTGYSEEVLADALKGIPREAYRIGSKVCRYEPRANNMFDFSFDRTLKASIASVKRLGLSYIDLLQAHDIEYAPSIDIVLNETLPALHKARTLGLTRHIGITSYSLDVLCEVLEKTNIPIDSVLTYSRYTLMDQTLLTYIDRLQSHNVSIISAAPFGMGLLTPKGPPRWHPASEELKNIAISARNLVKERGMDICRLALNYSQSLPCLSTILVGMDDPVLPTINSKHVQSPLSNDEWDTCNEIVDMFSSIKVPHWEGTVVDKIIPLGNINKRVPRA